MRRFKPISAASKHDIELSKIIDIETALYQDKIAIVLMLRIFSDGISRYEQREHRLTLILLNYIA